jgi:hypothetical protein
VANDTHLALITAKVLDKLQGREEVVLS